MSARTYRQRGMGYGTVPVNITAKINGNTVFSGNIITDVDGPPTLPDLSIDLGDPLFTWTNDDIRFQGTFEMEVTINNSVNDDCFMYLTDTEADYASWGAGSNLIFIQGPGKFASIFFETIDDPNDQPPWVASDPFTQETIDGVPKSRVISREFSGQWYWAIAPQQTFHCLVNTLPGTPVPPPYDNSKAYVESNRVAYLGNAYRCIANTTGNLPTDDTYWVQYGIIDID